MKIVRKASLTKGKAKEKAWDTSGSSLSSCFRKLTFTNLSIFLISSSFTDTSRMKNTTTSCWSCAVTKYELGYFVILSLWLNCWRLVNDWQSLKFNILLSKYIFFLLLPSLLADCCLGILTSSQYHPSRHQISKFTPWLEPERMHSSPQLLIGYRSNWPILDWLLEWSMKMIAKPHYVVHPTTSPQRFWQTRRTVLTLTKYSLPLHPQFPRWTSGPSVLSSIPFWLDILLLKQTMLKPPTRRSARSTTSSQMLTFSLEITPDTSFVRFSMRILLSVWPWRRWRNTPSSPPYLFVLCLWWSSVPCSSSQSVAPLCSGTAPVPSGSYPHPPHSCHPTKEKYIDSSFLLVISVYDLPRARILPLYLRTSRLLSLPLEHSPLVMLISRVQLVDNMRPTISNWTRFKRRRTDLIFNWLSQRGELLDAKRRLVPQPSCIMLPTWCLDPSILPTVYCVLLLDILVHTLPLYKAISKALTTVLEDYTLGICISDRLIE